MGKTHYYLGLDVGGTAMKAGIISADGSLVHCLSEPTNKNAGPAAGLALMEQVINLCIKKSGIDPDSIKAFGTGVPGIIDLKNGIILDAVNLTDWKNVPVRSHFSSRLGLLLPRTTRKRRPLLRKPFLYPHIQLSRS